MKYFLLLLLFGSCATHRGETQLSDSSRETPQWLYSPYDECREAEEFCATGEAKGQAAADAQARANLGSIFEVKVQTETSSFASSTSSFPWQAEVRQEVQLSLKESVDQLLETVQIKKRHREQGLTYALASLDRSKASELLGDRLARLDHELEVLWGQNQRTNLRRLVRLSLERERLNERYSIVSGAGRPAKVSSRDILRWKAARPRRTPLVLKVGQAPDWLVEKLHELLTEAGFQLVKGDAGTVLAVTVDSIREFLNVEGFEKYTFTLSLTSHAAGEKNKVLSVSETVTGRTQADALLKVRGLFGDYIENHLSELGLD